MLLFLCWLRHDWDILDVETCLKDCWIVLSYCCSPSFLLCNSLFSRSSLFLWNSSFTRFSIFISSCYSCYENNSKCSRIIRIIAFFLPVISFFSISILLLIFYILLMCLSLFVSESIFLLWSTSKWILMGML